VPVGGDVAEEGGEGGREGASRGFPAGLQGIPGGFLVGAHGAFAAEGGMGDSVDELGSFAHGEGDVVGEELGTVEAFVAIGAEVFLEVEGAEAVLVEEEGVAAEAFEAVLHGGGGTVQEPGDGAEVLTGGQGVVERGIGEGAFGVVIQLEGSLPEGFPAGVAAVAGNGAYYLGVVGTDPYEGQGTRGIPGSRRGMVGTGRVRAEGRMEHRRLRSFLRRKPMGCFSFLSHTQGSLNYKKCFT